MSSHIWRYTLLRLPLALVCCAPLAHGQEKWISLSPNFPPGTPALVQASPDGSNAQQTTVDVRIFGFWREEVLGADGNVYQRIRVPGLPGIGEVGKPLLPAVRTRLAVVTDVPAVKLAGVQVVSETSLLGYSIYPTPLPGMDEDIDPTGDPGEGDVDGSPDQFVIDAATYASGVLFPQDQAVPFAPVTRLFGTVDGAAIQIHPMQWKPTSGKLSVATHAYYTFEHIGPAKPTAKLAKPLGGLVKQSHLNAAAVQDFVLVDLTEYHSRYLMVVPEGMADALAPLILLKKKTGHKVTVVELQGGENWLQILAKIANWYGTGEPGMEHYCLLVGDTNRIPLPVLTNGVPSDDVYGSPLDLDLYEEVFVGRLSIDSEADLAAQVQRIVAYQTTPVGGGDYNRVLLAAHKEGAPDKYQGAHEDVRTASYAAATPLFTTAYGAQGKTNADVLAALASEVGLICYRGHGSTSTWAGWNNLGESFHSNQVIGAATPPILPVVWSISCTNMNLGTNGGGMTDCIGEVWMEQGKAVASYAATVGTGTSANHELDRRLFEGVYGIGFHTQAHAIYWGEYRMELAHPDSNNSWAYLLLGDPSMRIRTTVPPFLSVINPSSVDFISGSGLTPVQVAVKGATGAPAAGVLIAFHKVGPGGQDEVLMNRYTDSKGEVLVDLPLASAGSLSVAAVTDGGHVVLDEIQVNEVCASPAAIATYGQGTMGTHAVPHLSAVGAPELGATTTLRLKKAFPGSFPILVFGVNPASLPFNGGTLLVQPFLALTMPVPVQSGGDLDLSFTHSTDAIFCGFDAYFQYLVPDPGAGGPYKVALTNGLSLTLGS